MRNRRDGLLAQIEAGVLDDSVSLASLLQKCIVLGGQAGSEKMRDWARSELNGYGGPDTLPGYRRIPAPLMATITNQGGFNPITQRLGTAELPEFVREDVPWTEATLNMGVGELEALVSRGEKEARLSPGWALWLMEFLNERATAPNSVVREIYWPVSTASIQGLLVRVRTALAELVAELAVLTPPDQVVPDKEVADQVTQFVITGDRATINLSSQRATDGGINVQAGERIEDGAVVVSGTHGTSVGSQTALGGNAVVGGGTKNNDHSTIAGQNAPGMSTPKKAGVIVAISTVAAAVVAVLTWFGWTPWT